MIISNMQKENIADVLDLEKKCFSKSWTQKEIMYEYETNDFSKQYVVVEKDKIIGYALVWELYDQAELVRIGMDPLFRKRGFSKACLLEAMRQAKKQGCVTMSLEVRVSNASALHLYETCGFQYVHTSKHHYEDGEDAYIMIAQL